MLPNGSVGQLLAVGVCGALMEGVCALDNDEVGLAVGVGILGKAGCVSLTGADCGMIGGGTPGELTGQDVPTAGRGQDVIVFVVPPD